MAEIMYKINNGNGTLARLIEDSTISENINQMIINLKQGTKGLDENMKAAKSNFLLRGYFKKKEKEKEEKAKAEKEKQNNNKSRKEGRKQSGDKKRREIVQICPICTGSWQLFFWPCIYAGDPVHRRE